MAGTAAHQSVLIAFHLSLSQDWWYAFSASVLVETGIAQSRLFVGTVFPRIDLLVNHHEVLDCNAASKSFFWVLYAELIAEQPLFFQDASFSIF